MSTRKGEAQEMLGLATAPADTGQVDYLEEMVGALTDPIIVFPSSWQDTIPEKLKQDIPLRRLAHIALCQKGEAAWDEATDLEALLHLYPLTLGRPINETWTCIYLYLGTKCLRPSLSQDIREETLTDYQAGELRGLKRWLYRQRVKARKARGRQEKTEVRVEAKPPPQFKMF